MSYSIKHLYHIDATPAKVYQAISTIQGLANWWTRETEGNASLNGRIQFNFGAHKGPEMKVIKLDLDALVVWECTASDHFWKGNTFRFFLDENEGKTRVRFEHNGWKEQDDFYAACNFSWGRYLESLGEYCETGKGSPFGG